MTLRISGKSLSVGEALRYMKLGFGALIVIHDELDLSPGKVRVKIGGGDAGHNGLRSITAHLGAGYKRVRIGIGHPGIKEFVQPYVLQNFSSEEVTLWVAPLLDAVAGTIGLLLSGSPDAFMSEVARRFAPPDTDAPDGFGQSKPD